jgi:polar amino acid transport system permease protein
MGSGLAFRAPRNDSFPMTFTQTFLNLEVLGKVWWLLVVGLGATISLGVASIVFGTVLGLALALARLFGPRWLRLPAIAWIDIFRAFPALVVLILIYYALPFGGIVLPSFAAAVIALSIVLSAFTAEVFRAGIEAVPKSQFEAASALGLPLWTTLRKVVLPQAIRIVIPPQMSNYVSVMKDTALASVVAMPDLLKQATDAQALMANPSPLIGAAVIYLLLLWPMVRLVDWLQEKSRKAKTR